MLLVRSYACLEVSLTRRVAAQSIEQLQQTIGDLDEELKHAASEIEVARSDARHAVAEHQRVVHLQDETVNFLLQAVDDVKLQLSSAMSSGCVRVAPCCIQCGRADPCRILATCFGSASALTPDIMGDHPGPGAGGMPVRLDKLNGPLRERALQLLLAKMQLFQTTLWAGTGAQTTATQAVAAVPSLPPIGGGHGPDGLPPMSPMAAMRESKHNGDHVAAAGQRRRPSMVSVSTQTARAPSASAHKPHQPHSRASPVGVDGSNPFAPAHPGPPGRRKFKASAMRASSSLPSYASPERNVSGGSSTFGAQGPMRPGGRRKKARPRVGVGAPPLTGAAMHSPYAYIPPPAASGTGFSNELSGRVSHRSRELSDDLTSISVTGHRGERTPVGQRR